MFMIEANFKFVSYHFFSRRKRQYYIIKKMIVNHNIALFKSRSDLVEVLLKRILRRTKE